MNQQLPKRKPHRLKNFDYSSDGAYYITICTNNKEHILSNVIDHGPGEPAEIALTAIGKVVERYAETIPGIDKYVIMPNHVHLIIIKTNGKPLSSDIRSFKTLVTKQLGYSIWQGSFYDHVTRSESDYLTKWKYIDDNPAKWVPGPYDYRE